MVGVRAVTRQRPPRSPGCRYEQRTNLHRHPARRQRPAHRPVGARLARRLRLHRHHRRTRGYFFAYHTGETSIFLTIVHALPWLRGPADALADLERVRQDVGERTEGMFATTESENTFDRLLPTLARRLGTEPQTAEFQADEIGSVLLALAPTEQGLRVDLNDVTAHQTMRSVTIPTDDLWRFAAGMIWRSYADRPDTYPQLTRLSTAAYEQAVTALRGALVSLVDESGDRG